MAKRGEHKKFTSSKGINYIFQYPGLLESIRLRDRSNNEKGILQEEVYYDQIMEHVVFLEDGQPATWDHFDENGGFQEVIKEAATFTFRES